jgi:hypothetical protein
MDIGSLLIGLFVGAPLGALAMGWLVAGKVQNLQADSSALQEDLKTERKRTAAYLGECRKLDMKLWKVENKPSMGE